nr:MAG TPA: hypothetical protein [Caudoviricetes sp.]
MAFNCLLCGQRSSRGYPTPKKCALRAYFSALSAHFSARSAHFLV